MRLLLCIILLLLTGCRQDDNPTIINNTDPYLASFWSKGIKTMTLNHSPLTLDTTTFDGAGNISSIKKYGSFEKMAYNKDHFIIRELYRSDVRSNYVIDYRLENGQLLQYWRNVDNHMQWEYDSSALGSVIRSNRFHFDQAGRIHQVTKNDSTQVELIRYENELIVERRFISVSENRVWSKILYSYRNQKLENMEVFDDGMLIYQVHFKDGLPEYRKTERHQDTLFYRYTYY
jgi:hypothetical protein